MDEELIAETLETLADPTTAKRTQKQVTPLKGVRGVPTAEIARLAAAAWQEGPPDLHRDRDALTRLFGAAWEDGLVAIGLLAAATPDDPEEAWDIAAEWLDRVDDLATADALGWLVLGPAFLTQQLPLDALLDISLRAGPAVRKRAGLAAGLAWTTERLEGPSAAPLRARVGQKHVRFVEAPISGLLAPLSTAFLRQEDVGVRKVHRRLIRAWAKGDPAAVVAWADEVAGGLPKILRAETERARRLLARFEAHEGDDLDEDLA